MKIASRKNKNKKRLTIVILVALILALAYMLFAYATKDYWPFKDESSDPSENSQQEDNDTGIYKPPSEEDIEHSQDAKSRNDTKTEESSDDDGNISQSEKQPVEVGIAFADVNDSKLEIRAFVPSVIEGSGKCTATIAQGGRTITKTSNAFIDSQTSQCEPILVPLSELPGSGIWSVKVAYESSTNKGESSPVEVSI